jgi:O-antigen ligase
MWVFVWYDPDWFLEALGGGTILVRFYAIMFIPVCVLLMKYIRREALFWPYLLIIGIYLVWMPFALNRALLLESFTKVLQYALLTALTVSVLETPKQVVPLLKLFLFQFIWFGVQGLPTGNVNWHQNMGDVNSFGALMVIGLGYAYYLMMGATTKRYRYLALLVCLLAVAGTIMSLARGAFLGLCVVFAVLGARARRRWVFLGYGGLLAVVGLVVIMVTFPGGEFWNEMATITEEGTTAGTGESRWVLWQVAWELFLRSPILGVGPGNFGPNAVVYLMERDIENIGGGFNAPGTMYDRALHNDYVQAMVEQGLVGLFALAAVFILFFGCVRFLRTAAVQKAWASQTGGFLDPDSVARGLEAAMLGFMTTSVFYPQFFINYFGWSIMMLALVATNISRRMLKTRASTQQTASGRGPD